MNLTIQILLIILLAVGIIAVLRLYFVLGDVRQTLMGVDETRKELNTTVQRLNTLVSEEITPTLQSARATLDNLESTTRTLSQATQVLRAFGGSPDSRSGAQGSNPLVQFVTQQGTKLAIGLITTAGAGVISGLRGLFGRKKQLALPAKNKDRNKKTLPPAADDSQIYDEDLPPKQELTGSGRSK